MSKVCLIVIDGWGISENKNGNAIYHAESKIMDGLTENEDQYLTLDASGLSVGLPKGLMGNSEVGHLNIGAGRVLYQDIVRINMDVESQAIKQNAQFLDACNNAKINSGGRLHFLGLVSDGGVHSHINHLISLIDGANLHQVPNLFIHFFSDGRDTSPTSGVDYIERLSKKLKEIHYGSIATITGRYYAMDRDKRWERIQIAYEGMVEGKGESATIDNVIDLVHKRYSADPPETDEFLKPIILDRNGLIQDNDTLIFFDYRADRMRQIVETFGLKQNFDANKVAKNLKIYSMTEYKKEFPFAVLYPPVVPKNVLAEALSDRNIPQFHCAETEKYAHVTFFFNGGQEKAFAMEDRFMVPSPKVATYDLKPEMSVLEVGDKMAETISTGKYPFVMCNLAPPDMVGHTGKYEAAVKAVTATDKAIGVMKDACEKNNYVLLVTADHGNAEKMEDNKKKPHTAHTTNRVPFCMTGSHKFRKIANHNPALCDVAPSILDLMGIPIPSEMGGKSLIAK